jgi:AraC-like DNA-binding protein
MLFPASTARAMLAGFRVLGLDPEVLQREAGLDSTVLARIDGAFEPDCFPRLWAAAAARIAREELPTELGMAVPRGAFGAIDYLAGSSADVATGMQALARHFRQVSTTFSIDVAETEDGSGLVSLPCHEPFEGRFGSDEFTLSVICGHFRESADGPFHLRSVCLTRPQPTSKSRHAELFNAKVQFGCAVSSIEVPSDAWRLPLRHADPALQQTLRDLSNHLEFGTNEHDLQANLRMHLRVLLPDGAVTAAKAARCLCLSERTLQRQLTELGTSFTQELDNFRQVEAERLLRAGVPRIEVAFRLGFADQTTWNRAFRRWKGMSPSKWLEQQGAALVPQSKASKT